MTDQSTAEKAGIRVAGDVYEFNLSVTNSKGDVKKLASFAEPIRVNLKISEEANLDLVGIYRIEEDGNLTYIGGDVDEQTISADLSNFSKYAVLEYEKTYDDVPVGFWAHDTIKKLSARHILNGYTNGNFDPLDGITRAEFTTMIARTLNLETD